MISVKFKGLDRLVDDLRRARKKAIPYAIRDALNGAAFEARKEWQGEIRKTFTIRNTFNPSAPGTRIAPTSSAGMPVKGFASIGDMALINVEGTAMIGVPGIS